MTDGGNYIIDCSFPAVDLALTALIKQHAGIIEHGIFLTNATEVIVGGATGTRHLTRKVPL